VTEGAWVFILLIILSPLWGYVMSKMVTFGILKAKSQFQQQTESEEENDSESP